MPHLLSLAGTAPLGGSVLGHLFQPLYQAMAWILAAGYAIAPHYALAVVVVSVVVTAVTAPLTVSSVRAALAMARLTPELGRLRRRHRHDPARLSEETLALYRRHGVSPVAGFLPALLQIPVYVVLYGTIEGLTHTMDGGRVAAPLYVEPATALARSLHRYPGHLPFHGVDMAAGFLTAHGSGPVVVTSASLVALALALQWVQTRRLTRAASVVRAPAPPVWTRLLPLAFGLLYLRLPVAILIYVIVSAGGRLLLQELVLRTGLPRWRPRPGSPRRPNGDVGAPNEES